MMMLLDRFINYPLRQVAYFLLAFDFCEAVQMEIFEEVAEFINLNTKAPRDCSKLQKYPVLGNDYLDVITVFQANF